MGLRIWAFLVALVVAGCHSTPHRKHSVPHKVGTASKSAVPCSKRGRRVVSRLELQKRVIDALKRSDQKTLLQYAECDFLVGPPESDVGGIAPPEKIMKILISATHSVTWKAEGLDYVSQYNLPSEEAPTHHQLIFRQDPENDHWYWGGYSCSDPKVFEPMMKFAVPRPNESIEE